MSRLVMECVPFASLGPHDLYAMLALRSRVFVVEQECVFLDIDGLDQDALHLLGWSDAAHGALHASLRILAPGVSYDEPSIGRVVTAPEARGTGAGRALMLAGIAECERRYPGTGIRIGAQQYLERFYGSLGFQTVSAMYLEDGIPHVTMLRPG